MWHLAGLLRSGELLELGGALEPTVGPPLTVLSMFCSPLQFWLTMSYLSQMTEEQTLVMYSGHPLGLFPSSPGAPRLVITNGMVGTGAPGRSSGPGTARKTRCPWHLLTYCFPGHYAALSPWLLSIFSRSFPTTLLEPSMRSSLPWGLQCKSLFQFTSYHSSKYHILLLLL